VNTVFDFARFQNDLKALSPGNQVQLLTVTGIARNFGNGYIGSWTAGLDHDFRDFKFNASYVATAGIHLPRAYWPNSYAGADLQFAPFTQFEPRRTAHSLSRWAMISIRTPRIDSRSCSCSSVKMKCLRLAPKSGFRTESVADIPGP